MKNIYIKTLLAILLLTSCSQHQVINREPVANRIKVSICVQKVQTIFKKIQEKQFSRLSEGFFKNQCSFGSCWSHANSGILENLIKREFGEDIEISTSFFFYHHMRNQIQNKVRAQVLNGFQNISKVKPDALLVEGANFDTFYRLLQQHGARPLLSERDRVFEQNLARKKIKFKQDILGLLKQPRIQMKLNNLLNEYQDIKEIPKEYLEVIIKDITDSAIGLLDKMFPVKTGPFRYKGAVLTNNDFAEKYSLKGLKRGQLFVDKKGTNLEKIKKILKERIDSKKNTYITLAWQRKFLDKKTGVFSIPKDVRFVPNELNKLKKQFAHAVQIVGYEEDEFGKVSSWVVQNSHGRNVGQNGYFYLEDNFVNHFLTSMAYLEIP